VLTRFGLVARFVSLEELARPDSVIGARTRLVWFESPVNPTLRCVDVRPIAEACRTRGVLSVMDNTFASPINQQPLALGVDLSMQSATKYLNGHSDVTGGVVTGPRALSRAHRADPSPARDGDGPLTSGLMRWAAG
jgi:cystathionine beta-lyase/cystathionine gamma-synthase